MIMDDLDLLKKNWQKQDSFNQVSEQDIYEMLQKKSSSIVKWLFFMSVLEFLFCTIMNVFTDGDNILGNKKYDFYFELLEYFSFLVTLIFVYLLWNNYKKISTISNTKKLMSDILNTKKIVNYYVIYNLVTIVFVLIIGFAFLALKNTDNPILAAKITENPSLVWVLTAIFIVVAIIILAVIWLFYKLLYGILLKKLYSNYEELKKIDY